MHSLTQPSQLSSLRRCTRSTAAVRRCCCSRAANLRAWKEKRLDTFKFLEKFLQLWDQTLMRRRYLSPGRSWPFTGLLTLITGTSRRHFLTLSRDVLRSADSTHVSFKSGHLLTSQSSLWRVVQCCAVQRLQLLTREVCVSACLQQCRVKLCVSWGKQTAIWYCCKCVSNPFCVWKAATLLCKWTDVCSSIRYPSMWWIVIEYFFKLCFHLCFYSLKWSTGVLLKEQTVQIGVVFEHHM